MVKESGYARADPDGGPRGPDPPPFSTTLVGYFVLSLYAQDRADASQVECVKHSLLPGICSQCLIAIQQYAGNTGIVDRHICLHRQLGACPHSSRETSES